ncbi:MAG: universal stress protein [Sphaerochaeta sp.]|jgi:nucleotide-binding universal stress UspA family protein|uniref:universal stress protein n=1 Tax=Sphaerochaeta sp. TaxID=1972642 RepID=UPI0017ECF23E|nr:universal stress protein [Sphaerochaeta sp.]NLA96840.1 universal stress protein [Spirochaetales bacterium]MDD2394705.1 universal stress protein [Sphaerochaeta sp.]MDD3423776.1 universal stress protein [Sphaerochaeta sp.]MDD4037907.1 universal stress protein [Sphaerochaeta sp.]MDX9983390.1 universal stress protein [Sphaerochaeta sp.]
MGVPFKQIVVYLDGSESSMTAIMYGIKLAKEHDAKLTAVYVINTRALSELVKAGIFVAIERDEYQKDLQQDADRYLRHASRLASQKMVAIETVKLEGAVHMVMKDLLKAQKADLLVLGGITDIRSRREELASETDRMMRTSPCPVLVVRDDDDIWLEFEA